jgi:hypothetical protein
VQEEKRGKREQEYDRMFEDCANGVVGLVVGKVSGYSETYQGDDTKKVKSGDKMASRPDENDESKQEISSRVPYGDFEYHR